MKVLKHYILTSDQKEFEWDGQSIAQKNKAKLYEMNLSQCTSKEALKKLRYELTYICDDGFQTNKDYEAISHDKELLNTNTAKIIADIFYQGSMTKEEYTLHISKNLDSLNSIFHTLNFEDDYYTDC
jgi:hypothetical protein